MIKITSLSDLQSLISDGVEEGTQLDYKSGIDKTKEKWKSEIAKDISAMANSNGGVIIYGIKEYDEPYKRYLPEKIVPLDTTEISRETLMQVITNNISPKVEGVEIQTIPVSQEKPNEVIYVVTVPQSSTAHQNLRTKQYFKRYGSTTDAMEDYEIRDVMNRCTHPDVRLEFEIREKSVSERYLIQQPYNPLCNNSEPITKVNILTRREFMLIAFPRNIGRVVAEHLHWFIHVPLNLLEDKKDLDIQYVRNGYAVIRRENMYCDILPGSTENNIKYGPPRIVPVLPRMTGPSKGVFLIPNVNLNQEIEIKWELYADCAPVKQGSIKLSEISRKS